MFGALIAGGIAGLGSLLSGSSQNKAAKNQQRNVDALSLYAIDQAKRDQAKALELAAADEARLKAATGYDLVKLREDAMKGGFNPLTVLQATGGAGYDGRGAVVMSPFMPIAGDYWNRANLYAGGSAAIINSAGYIGDAIGSAGSAFFNQANQQASLDLEAARVSLARDELAMMAQPFGGGFVRQTTSSPNSQATSSPFFPGSISKMGSLAKDWWNIVPEIGLDTIGIWKKYSRFGTSSVYPEGPDVGSIASGAALEGLALAKLRGYVPLDVERGLWDRVSGAAALGWGGLYRGAQWTSALMGRPPISW